MFFFYKMLNKRNCKCLNIQHTRSVFMYVHKLGKPSDKFNSNSICLFV